MALLGSSEVDLGDTLSSGDTTVRVGGTKEWTNATISTLDQTKNRVDRISSTLRALEQQKADRLNAQRAERKRLVLLAKAEEKKRREEQVAEQAKRLKELQQEERQRQQELLNQQKGAERAELQAATANFKRMQKKENEAREKERVERSLQDTSQLILEGVLECKQLTSKLWGSLMLCEKRQKVRESRPEAELFHDCADEALQREWQMLTASRAELTDLAKRGEALQDEIDQVRRSMVRAARPSSAPISTGFYASGQPTVQDVLRSAVDIIEKASELPRQSKDTRSRVDAECEFAMAEVHASLDHRKAELSKLISRLQDQKADAERTISDAQRRIVRLKNSAQNATETPRTSQATAEQLDSAESLVLDLKSLKSDLEIDLGNKYYALKIDESCRQLTKIRSGGHRSRLDRKVRRSASEGAVVRRTAKDGQWHGASVPRIHLPAGR